MRLASRSFWAWLSVGLLCFWTGQGSLVALDAYQFFEKNQNLPPKAFLQKFPFETYLKQVDWTKLPSLEQYRTLLNQHGQEGDRWVYELAQAFVKERTWAAEELSARLQLAQTILAFAQDQEAEVYEMVAMLFFEKITHHTERALNEGHWSKNSPEAQHLIQALEKHKFVVNVPPSQWEKIQYHFWQGHWGYLWSRACLALGLCNSWRWAWLSLGLLGLMAAGHWYWSQKTQSK
ncbi:MAG: hypothetical protein OHK0053_28500 [Microscillaceae bacterium]